VGQLRILESSPQCWRAFFYGPNSGVILESFLDLPIVYNFRLILFVVYTQNILFPPNLN
jgi:hypothetical protein